MKIVFRKTLILSLLTFYNICLFSLALSRKEFIKIVQNADVLFYYLDGVAEVSSDDGYYRYILGEYDTFTEAKEALRQVHKSEFRDAWIRYSLSPR